MAEKPAQPAVTSVLAANQSPKNNQREQEDELLGNDETRKHGTDL